MASVTYKTEKTIEATLTMMGDVAHIKQFLKEMMGDEPYEIISVEESPCT